LLLSLGIKHQIRLLFTAYWQPNLIQLPDWLLNLNFLNLRYVLTVAVGPFESIALVHFLFRTTSFLLTLQLVCVVILFQDSFLSILKSDIRTFWRFPFFAFILGFETYKIPFFFFMHLLAEFFQQLHCVLVVLDRFLQCSTLSSANTGVISKKTVNTWSEGLSHNVGLNYNVIPAPDTVNIVDQCFDAVIHARFRSQVRADQFQYVTRGYHD